MKMRMKGVKAHLKMKIQHLSSVTFYPGGYRS